MSLKSCFSSYSNLWIGSKAHHRDNTSSNWLSKRFVLWQIRWKLCSLQLQKLLCPMCQRISLLSSLLAFEIGIQSRLQSMSLQQKRWMRHHKEMAPSHHLRLSGQMSPLRSRIQWKCCWPRKQTTIRCMLERSYSWMYCLSRNIGVQPTMERLSLPRTLQNCSNLWR